MAWSRDGDLRFEQHPTRNPVPENTTDGTGRPNGTVVATHRESPMRKSFAMFIPAVAAITFAACSDTATGPDGMGSQAAPVDTLYQRAPVDTFLIAQRAPVDTFLVWQRAPVDTFLVAQRAPVDTFLVAQSAPVDTLY